MRFILNEKILKNSKISFLTCLRISKIRWHSNIFMKILTEKYLNTYKKSFSSLGEKITLFRENTRDMDFTFLIESSSVFSSNIEWNTLDLNSFMNAKMNQTKTKDVEEIDALIEAYTFARKSILDQKSFLHTHFLSSKTLLIPSKRGVYRDDRVGVFGTNWLIYLAIEGEFVDQKMQDLFDDIGDLLQRKLDEQEIFYYASLIHLIFVHIHPFADGNGRTARLLEKWFLVSKLSEDFWKLESERYYKEHRAQYYKNINLWVNYYELDYDRCMPFLSMLPESLLLYFFKK